MPDKTASELSVFLTWGWVIGLSTLGGLVSYFNKINTKRVKFNWVKLVTELITSAFVGIITYLLCDWSDLNESLTGAFVGIAGHMGTRAIFMFENYLEERITGKTNEDKL